MYDLDGWAHAYSGKVRDLYVPQDASGYGSGDVILVVASDRISAFDHILPTQIPDKGKILTQLSLWWFNQIRDVVPNHVVSLDVPAAVEGRAMICRRLEMVPIEAVARGYLSGGGLAEHRATGGVCGIPLSPGLREGDRLPETIFTPAPKAALGEHDENISFDEVGRRVGPRVAHALRDVTLALYERARQIAAGRGLILADTKFEFGHNPDEYAADLMLADEALTPDSSRYWAEDSWSPGQHQINYDKQFVRDWLVSPASRWNRAGEEPPPALPDEIVEKTRERYLEAYRRLTGSDLAV